MEENSNNLQSESPEDKNDIVNSKGESKVSSTPNLDNDNNTEDKFNYQTTLRREMHSGPPPDASTLQAYNEICPGAADRIIAMAEKQQDIVSKKCGINR